MDIIPLPAAFKAKLDEIHGHADNLIAYYDRKGQKIGYGRYFELWRNPEYRRIARFEGKLTDKDVSVSTVWIGMVLLPSEKHLTFETMVSMGNRNLFVKSETEAAAQHAHDAFVKAISDGSSVETLRRVAEALNDE